MTMSGLRPAAKPITSTAIPSSGQRLMTARYRCSVLLASASAPPRRPTPSLRRPPPVREELQGDGLRHHAVSRRPRMQMIAAVIGGQQSAGMPRVPHRAVEIHHGIEMPGLSDPCVDRLAVRFALGRGVVIVGPPVRSDGPADDEDP